MSNIIDIIGLKKVLNLIKSVIPSKMSEIVNDIDAVTCEAQVGEIDNISVSSITLAQSLGDNAAAVISQKAVTDALIVGEKRTTRWLSPSDFRQGSPSPDSAGVNGSVSDCISSIDIIEIPSDCKDGFSFFVGEKASGWRVCIQWLNGSKAFISRTGYSTTYNISTIPSNAEYFRIGLSANTTMSPSTLPENTIGLVGFDSEPKTILDAIQEDELRMKEIESELVIDAKITDEKTLWFKPEDFTQGTPTNGSNSIYSQADACIASKGLYELPNAYGDIQTIGISAESQWKIIFQWISSDNTYISRGTWDYHQTVAPIPANAAFFRVGLNHVTKSGQMIQGDELPENTIGLRWVEKGNSVSGRVKEIVETNSEILCDLSNRVESIETTIGSADVDALEYYGERIVLRPKCSVKILNVSEYSGNIPKYSSTQGMDVWNDKYLFQGYAKTSDQAAHILVFDIQGKAFIRDYVLDDGYDSNFHNNMIVCGEKFSTADTFPLLYLSETYAQKRCFVHRLNNDDAGMTILQTIQYSGTHLNSSGYEWCPDKENGYIYAFDEIGMLRFRLPSVSEGDVIFGDSDILWEHTNSPALNVAQGAKVINNKIYAPIGNGTTSAPAKLKVFDFAQERWVSEISLGSYEPEDVALFDGGLLVAKQGSLLYNILYF